MRKIAADNNYYILKAGQLSGYYTGLDKHSWGGRLVVGCTEGDETDYCNQYRTKFASFAAAWMGQKEKPFWGIMGSLQDANSGEFYSWFNSLFQEWVDESGFDEDELIKSGEIISGADVHDLFVQLFPDKEGSLTRWKQGTKWYANEVTDKSSWGLACDELAEAFNK